MLYMKDEFNIPHFLLAYLLKDEIKSKNLILVIFLFINSWDKKVNLKK